MANPIAYNSGTTVSGCINKGTISLAVHNLNYSTRPGNLNWYAGGDNTNKYIIISDTYSQGVDTQANSRPTMWATSALTDNELLKWINGLPARSGQSTFATLTNAISWLTSQNKYLISNQHYPQIVTSGMVLNLDAGFTASYPNVGTSWYDLYSGGTGSLNNGPVWNNLGMSSNISFDGTNDYYELTNRNTSLEFQPNQPYSCLVFYRSPASVTYGALIADMQDSGTPAYPGWDIWFNNGDIGEFLNYISNSNKKILIFVVDSFSTDATVEILNRNNINYIQNSYLTHAKQINVGIDRFPFQVEWILKLDCDELLTDELIENINHHISNPSQFNGFFIQRKVYFLGGIMNFGMINPIWLLRLWKLTDGRCNDLWMDEKIELKNAKTTQLSGFLIDHNLNDLTWWTQKHNRYASQEAFEILRQKYGLNTPMATDTKDKWVVIFKKGYNRLPIFIRPFLLFIYAYILKLGFLDGKRGLIWNFLQVFWYRFLVDVKVFETEINTQFNADKIRTILKKEFEN
jgi:glycosyltransferase involved in cell wall biosynthesis